ncbi:tRNA lysidine(34) synthetase TilS [Aureimonas mangrovi]|uniref:tRNA lysidine(34) synthetase TilS n=1 Tax=Aureimonas mangrovi TaxID=2758041 RepID=UPI00163D9994|nr:tRNA lysidine(34) synthetase TilS [Aureimonas mangrovi]
MSEIGDDPVGPDEGFELLRPSLTLGGDGGVVLAVSGGADSLLLLVLAGENRARLGRPITVVTVDHGLRMESGAEAEAVREAAAHYGLPHHTMKWRGPQGSGNLSAQAREGRYALLAQAAREASAGAVITAHHQDDQIETHLLAAERGEGKGRQAAMRRARALAPGVTLLRPFLALARTRIEASLRARGLEWAEDPTNRDARYARTRMRAILKAMPHAERQRHLARIAALAAARDQLDSEVAAFLAPAIVDTAGMVSTSLGEWRGASPAVRAAALSRILTAVSGGSKPPTAFQARRLAERIGEGGTFVATLAGCRLEVRPDRLCAAREFGRTGPRELVIEGGAAVLFDGRFEIGVPQEWTGARVVSLGALGFGNRVNATLPVIVSSGREPLAAHPQALARLGAKACPLDIREQVTWRLRRDLPAGPYRLLDQNAAKAPRPVGNELTADYLRWD